jgi:hypothetical protein
MNGETEIFDRLRSLEKAVAKIDAKQDALDDKLCVKFDAMDSKLDERCSVRANALVDHDTRLRTLEESEHKRKGSIAALLGMLTAAGAAGAAAIRMIGG